jgi:hypothetical protein
MNGLIYSCKKLCIKTILLICVIMTESKKKSPISDEKNRIINITDKVAIDLFEESEQFETTDEPAAQLIEY